MTAESFEKRPGQTSSCFWLK